jgi:secreted trypsin-like serine protease
MGKPIQRTSWLSDRNRGNKIGVLNLTPIEAIIAPEDRSTGPSTTTATSRTTTSPTSPSQMHPEMVNFVFTAK